MENHFGLNAARDVCSVWESGLRKCSADAATRTLYQSVWGQNSNILGFMWPLHSGIARRP
jgi:hypothetical protein